MEYVISPLSNLECIDDALGTRLQFENPSDAIFARLFLQNGGISWSSFDILLSAIQNPSFDAKQVTFKDSADFAARIATIRERDLMRQRTPEVHVHGIPEVILDGVIDALVDELEYDLGVTLKESHGFSPSNMYFDMFIEMLRSWKATLINCALVHSSWLAPARRALGCFHYSNNELLPRSARNPWIGKWTKEMHLRIRIGDSSTPSTTPLLTPLLTRLPHLQHLQFTFHTGIFGTPIADTDIMSSFCETLRLLPCLTELGINASDASTSLVQTLLAIPLPNLKILRLLEKPFYDFDSLELPQQLSSLLSAFPSLCALHYDNAARNQSSHELLGVSWNKFTNDFSSSSSRAEILPFYVRTCVSNYPGSDQHPNWRRWWSSLPAVERLYCLCYYMPYYTGTSVARELQDLFAFCTSLRSLSVTMGYPETGTPGAMVHIPHTVEELEFTFSTVSDGLFQPIADRTTSFIEEWDADLEKALHEETSPRLRAFKVYFSRTTVYEHAADMLLDALGNLFRKLHTENTENEESHTTDSKFIPGPLLPSCQKVCEERGIQFSVEMLMLF